jgi:enoyl-[acyl-carrier protein] reductase III
MKLNGDKKNLTALVTGGSRGIGRSISLMLAEHFAEKIFINYVQNDDGAQKTKILITEKCSCETVFMKYNIAYPDEIDKMFSVIESSGNGLNIFVHCAAVNAFKPLSNITPRQWDLIMNVNARSFLYCSQKCIPIMKKGSIVAISSLGSRKFIKNYGSLSETKAALETIVRDLGVELTPKGIRVNGITAGLVETDSLSNFPGSAGMIEYAIRSTPAGRIGKPDDIANAVAFLISPLSEWITGQNIIIDGGMSLS